MKIKDLSHVRDLSDLKELNTNDVIGLLDELRVVATKRGTELLGQGRHQARKAIGAPDGGTIGSALLFGIVLGAVVAAVATLLMTPMRGTEARRRLTDEVVRVRERRHAPRPDGNGRRMYEQERTSPDAEVATAGGSSSGVSA